MKIQVLFGSPSDERVYGPLCRSLEKCGTVAMEVASAHRHPERVRAIVSECGADLFVAGAGLAAHLPGVVASLTDKPVFGVAVNGAFAGLDSFLSIAQMPKGVPVMAVTEDHAAEISEFLLNLKNLRNEQIDLHWNRNAQEFSPIQKTLEDIENLAGVKVQWCAADDKTCLGQIVGPADTVQVDGLNLFLCESEQLSSSNMALEFLGKARQGGFWVGANNIKNFIAQREKLLALKD